MALSDKGTKTARDKIKRDKFIEKFKELNPGGPKLPKKPKGPKRMPFPLPKNLFPKMEPMPFKPKGDLKRFKELLEEKRAKKPSGGPTSEDKKRKGSKPKKMAKGGFPDLSGDGKVTQKDILMGRGVIKKAAGGSPTLEKGKEQKKKKKKKKMPGLLAIGIEIIKPKKPIKAANGGLAGRLAKRGYGKAR